MRAGCLRLLFCWKRRFSGGVRYAAVTVGLLFVLFAYWQLNDAEQYRNHDNWFWIVYYLAAAVMTLWHARVRLPLWLCSGMTGFSLGAALFRMQDEVGNFDFMTPFRATAVPSQMNASIQAPNETGGLLLVAAWFLFLALAVGRGRRA